MMCCTVPPAILLIGLLPGSAFAYIGPGAGLSALGAVIAVLAGILVALFGFFYYPIKRLRKRRREAKAKRGPAE